MKIILSLLGVIIVVFGCNAQQVEHPKKKLIFKNSDSSYYRVYSDTSSINNETYSVDSFAYKNVTYSRESITNDKGNEWYIVKKTNYINYVANMEGQYSKFNLNIYSIKPTGLVQSITKNSDEIFINENYISTIKHGCCGVNNTGELSTIWDNKTFLKYDTKYFCVEIGGGIFKLYFGYVGSPNEKDTTKGILYYVIATGERIKGIADIRYTYKYHSAGKVIFKAKTFVKVGEMEVGSDASGYVYYLSNKMHLIKTGEQGWKPEGQNYEELGLYLSGTKTTLNDITITPLQIRSWSDTAKPISIPIIHGYLYGDSVNTERTIYIK